MGFAKAVRTLSRQLADAGVAGKIREYRQIDGFLSRHEAATLYRYAARVGPGATILEIGCWKGKSTVCLARGLRDGRVCVIDPFDAAGEAGSKEVYDQKKGDVPLVEQFQDNLRGAGLLDKIEILKGYSRDFVGRLPRIDLLFIDGDHSQEGCDFDFRNLAPAIPRGGHVLFHDFDARRPTLGPTWVVQNRVLPSNEFIFRGLYDSLWVARRK